MSKKRTIPLTKGTAMEQKVETPVNETDNPTVVTEGSTELDTSEAKEGEATGEAKTPVEGETLVEDADAPVDTEATKIDGLAADFDGVTDGLDVKSDAVGLESLNPVEEEKEEEVQHYVDPIDQYSTFARTIRSALKDYVEHMSPTYPVTVSVMLSKQEMLSRSLTRILKNPDVIEFQEAMDVLTKYIKANAETFSPRYINRGMDNVALSKDARKQFETIMFILPIAFNHPEGTAHYLNYGPQLSKIFPEDASGEVASRLQAWMKRYLSIE